ncbi:DegT/DnrJ/EryC1/StrS family aminotransferase [SAR86 cluster bacterium]|nr:DegT/DnrJ/EryC1/StrS family aminotransferase [SAR86 cluster bacterium]
MKDDYIRVPYGSTVHGEEEIQAVVDVLKTTTQMSKNVSEFEDKIAQLFDKNYGVMTNSGTSALYLAMESLNLKKGSEVITPALTFATTVGCLVKNGLVPSFVDVRDSTYCIDENQIESKITKDTKAILAPDLLGNLCNWKIIKDIAEKNNLLVLHDSADTLGATIDGIPVGTYTDLSITSFYGSHIINGAGNGGMLCSNDEDIVNQSKLLRSWGRSSSLFKESEAIENRFNIELSGIPYDAKFVFDRIGYQLEPSEISAAFGLVQLEKLTDNLKKRREIFDDHQNFFKKFEDLFLLPNETEGAYTGWLAYPLLIKKSAKFSRRELQIFLEERNIQTRVVFTGNILRQPGFDKINCVGRADDFPQADNVMRNGILIACHHGLNSNQMEHIQESFKLFIQSKA